MNKIKLYEKFIDSNQIENTFLNLKENWINEVGYQSNPDILYSNKNYKDIILLGEKVVPFLFKDLVSEGGDWFYALSEILKVNPVKKDHNGYFDKMKKDWQEYFKK